MLKYQLKFEVLASYSGAKNVCWRAIREGAYLIASSSNGKLHRSSFRVRRSTELTYQAVSTGSSR
jgi:hypothetical protein